MIKFKTLKDIYAPLSQRKKHISEEQFGEEEDLISRIDVKTEAVKWVKRMLKIYEKGDTLCKKHGKITKDFELDLYDYEQDDVAGAVKFAKYFFNITEEDLK